MPTDLLAADAAAVSASVALVAQASDLSLRTPCAGWDLGALIAHMTDQHRIFASASRGGAPVPPVRTYAEAAQLVLDAFAEPGVLDRPFRLDAFPSLPGRQAVGFHLVDYVVHAWDVAATLGLPLVLDQDVLELALPVARAVPSGPARDGTFAPALDVPADAPALDEILLLLGRDPKFVGGSC